MPVNFEKDLVLENQRVKIEALNRQDFDKLLPIAINEPYLLKYLPSKFGTEKALNDYFETNLKLKSQGLKYPFIIYDKNRQCYAGSTSFLNISDVDERLEIGSTWLGTSFQKSGLNHNCKFLLLQYIFEILNYKRAEFKTDSRNLQSQKAIERIGGIYEGTLRSHTVMQDGYRRHTVYYSMLLDEWKTIKTSVFADLL